MRPRPEAVADLPTDDVTLARAQRGDAAAFEAIVRRHQGLVWSYLWRMSGAFAARPLVEDLFQETFFAVHRGLARFSAAGPARLSTWILSIATRVALYRRRSLSRELPAVASGLDRSDGGAQASSMEHGALLSALKEALAALDPKLRAMVLLREFHGLEYDEMAGVLDLPVGTVRSRHRARESLRRALEPAERQRGDRRGTR